MSERAFDLEHLDAEHLRRIADRLRTTGFTEDGVRDRLGIDDVSAIRLDAYPYYINERLRRRDRLDIAILLLLLQGVIAVEEMESLFEREDRKLLKEAGILLAEKSTRTYRAAVSLYPLRDRLFFTDHRFRHMPWIRSRAPQDPVMYLGADSYYLARTTIRRRSRAVLDLCTGSGVHAILGAAHADRCVGVDTNPRAINFSRLNAIVNDAWNAVFLEGDLFRAVGGERFDAILANPPFVPSPVYELRYRDGGPSGADVLRRLIASIPDYLATGGCAQIVTHLGEREGESYLDRVRRWLSGANMNLHALKV
ncbi:methyltransferase [bacterium]|nr:methyltransferase [bacterium]